MSVENASGATRFANGDWTDLPRVMPLIDKLVRQAGWAPFVMDTFLTMCERAGTAYPIDAFADQVTAALSALRTTRASWTGFMHPARLSGMVQVLADANYPLTADQSRGLLFVLDALIDLGDRRSAALEQSEAFRNTQNPENLDLREGAATRPNEDKPGLSSISPLDRHWRRCCGLGGLIWEKFMKPRIGD